MRWAALAALGSIAALLVLALSGCARPGQTSSQPSGLQDEADRALASLLAGRDAEGRWPAGQVPYVAEAAHAMGKDLRAWPEPVPVADQVAWPPDDAPLLQGLRQLHAVALSSQRDAAALERVRERVMASFDGAQFGDRALLNDDAFALAVLGVAGDAAHAASPPEVEPAVAGLIANRSADGGWSWSVGGGGETDMTGLVLAGLAAAGAVARVEPGPVLAFLASTAADGGGHALAPGGTPNCDSTVWAIRAQDILGIAAPQAAWDFLLGLQLDDGSFAYSPGGAGNALCTAEAATLLGLAQAVDVVAPRR